MSTTIAIAITGSLYTVSLVVIILKIYMINTSPKKKSSMHHAPFFVIY